MDFPSKLVEDAVRQISKLPGIGKKSALRLVLHILKSDEVLTSDLTQSLTRLRENIKYCLSCHSISDGDICRICESHRRDKSLVCIVADTKDVLAIENTNQYFGLYHVLGGVIDPINGVGPSELNIESLVNRVRLGEVKEVIIGLNPTMEGDTTSFYISKKLKDFDVKISSIARGVPIGGELEYADEVTLGRSILTRIKYKVS